MSLILIDTSFAQELSPGSQIASSGTEAGAIPEKIRDQIVELSQGIARRTPQFLMVGKAEYVGGSSYMVNGDTFIVGHDTIINGDFSAGKYIEVRGELIQGKPKVAGQIVVNPGSAPTEGRSSGKSTSYSPPGMTNPKNMR